MKLLETLTKKTAEPEPGTFRAWCEQCQRCLGGWCLYLMTARSTGMDHARQYDHTVRIEERESPAENSNEVAP